LEIDNFMVTTDQIKELRDRTSVSMMVCKKALEEAGGDMEKALEVLKAEGVKVADKKSSRELKAGVIFSYIHPNKQIGVMLEARAETDFVSKNDGFQQFTKDIAMHIAASEVTDTAELLKQPFIKNPEITVEDYLKEHIQKFGENMEITRFVKYSIV